MNIMELCLSPGRGGLELYMARSVEYLSASHRVLAVINGRRSLIKDFLSDRGLPYLDFRAAFTVLPLPAAWRLARIIDREGIEAIHVHWRKDLPLAALAKRLAHKQPALVYTRQMKISHRKDDLYHNFIYSRLDLLLTITKQLREDTRKRLHPRHRDKVQLLYYGTEPPNPPGKKEADALKRKLHLREGEFVVGLIGKLMEGKGQHLLIEALGRMKSEGLKCKALLAGPIEDEAYVARLRRMVAEHGVQEEVSFMDFVKNPQELMQVCDCVVLATYQETFGLVLIEAMSVGKAVIGSDAGGVPEIIDDGVNGLLFETKNSTSLYDKLCILYHDREKALALGRAGRRKAAELFSLQNHYAQLEKLIQSVLPGGAKER